MNIRPSSLLSTLALPWLLALAPAARAQTTATFTSLHSFDPSGASNADGRGCGAGLVQGLDGNFYGVCANGGANGTGTFFRIDASGNLTVPHAFAARTDPASGNTNNADGTFPDVALIQGSNGAFYGTAEDGGANGTGTIFQVTPGGTLTVLHNFAEAGEGPDNDGGDPGSSLLADDVGNLYGTTFRGGLYGDGEIFRLSPTGTLTILHSFGLDGENGIENDGASPQSGLIQGLDGNFYGTTRNHGANDAGVIYRLTPAGDYAVVYQFTARDASGHNAEGAFPETALILGRDGNFYGTATAGGANGSGTVFRFTPPATVTALHSFDTASSDGFSLPTNTEGRSPSAALLQAADGNFYGTTVFGGVNGNGTIFQLTPAGDLTVLHTFSALVNYLGNDDGARPLGNLIQDASGTFYGTTLEGGANGEGTVFKFTVMTAGTPTPSPSPSASPSPSPSPSASPSPSPSPSPSASAPVITSATTATTQAGLPYTYQIAATDSPTSYLASGLPAGLTLDPASGLISGTPTISPTVAGTYQVALTAVNAAGSGTTTLTLTVTVPTITVTTQGKGQITEGKLGKAKILVSRTGDTTLPLTVTFKVKGMAIRGVDYKDLGTTITIPAGAASTKLKVKSLDDAALAMPLPIKVKLKTSPDGSYALGTAASAKVFALPGED